MEDVLFWIVNPIFNLFFSIILDKNKFLITLSIFAIIILIIFIITKNDKEDSGQ